MNRRTTLMLVSMNPQISAAVIMAAAFALNFSQPSPALAWFDQGHMTIAAAAYDQLTPAAKRRVAELLALSGYPTNGTNNARPDQAAKAAMMMAATAVDAIKKDHDFKDDGEDPTDSAKAPDPGRNTGFDDKFMHKYWHYIDKPFSQDGTALRSPPAINAQERIALFRRTIASDAPDELKAFDLVWLLHLVGDVHQPLHATSRFTPKGDSRGNDVKLSCSGCPSELHRFWEDVLGTDGRVSVSIGAARLLPPADPTEAGIKDEAVWIDESFRVAQQSVYVDPPIGNGTGPFALTDNYKNNAKRVALARAALAAARLANMLNNELK